MKLFNHFLFGFLLFFGVACQDALDENNGVSIFNYQFDFKESQHEWQAGFSGHSSNPNDTVFNKLKFAYTDRPTSSGEGKSIMLSGNNTRKDLFMYIKRKVENLEPDTDYTLTFKVEVITNTLKAYSSSYNIEDPESGIYLKAGATEREPKSVVVNGIYTMNINKGTPGQSGQHMTIIGDISTPNNTAEYSLITRSNSTTTSSTYAPFEARTNDSGELWLIVGTDSGYQGPTTIYITKVDMVFSKSKKI